MVKCRRAARHGFREREDHVVRRLKQDLAVRALRVGKRGVRVSNQATTVKHRGITTTEVFYNHKQPTHTHPHTHTHTHTPTHPHEKKPE